MKCGNGVKRTVCPRQTLMAVAVASVLWMLAADAQSQSTYVKVNSTGAGAVAGGSDSVAIGQDAVSLSPNGIAIGKDSRAYIDDGVAIGNGAVGSSLGVAIGTGVTALHGDVAIGYRAQAIASRNPYLPVTTGNIAIGAAETTGEGADQTGPIATEGYGIAIGTATQANGVAAIAIGQKAVASKDRGMAIGMNAQALNADDVALGGNSVTDVSHETRSVTIGNTSFDFAGGRPTGVLSVGAPGRERQITNVAAGRVDASSTDAVNGSQLHATNQVVSANTTSITDLSARVNKSIDLVMQENGSWDGAIMIGPSTGGDAMYVGGRQIKGVMDGVDENDAATVGQLGKVSTALSAVSTVASHGARYVAVNASGPAAQAAGVGSVAVGENANAASRDDIAMGQNAAAGTPTKNGVSSGNVAIGGGALAAPEQYSGIGNATAIGSSASATGFKAIAIGAEVKATSLSAIAIGGSAQGDFSVALGAGTSATGLSVALGVDAATAGTAEIAIGAQATTKADDPGRQTSGNIAIGTSSGALYGLSGGTGAAATGGNAVAISTQARASGNAAVAIGNGSTASGVNTLALSNGAIASGENAVAIGASARAGDADAVALGANSVTGVAHAAPGATIGGVSYTFAGTNPTSVVSVGASGSERQIANVAAGTLGDTSTDAVNGSQLHATNRAVSANTTSITDLSTGIAKGTLGLVQQAKGQADGAITIGAATGGSTVNVAGTSGARQIKGVADGADASDAATVGQLGKVSTALSAVSTVASHAVQYDDEQHAHVKLGGASATAPVGLSNVAAGVVSETSTEAVNGSQLHATNRTVSANTASITALSSGIAKGTLGLVQQAKGQADGAITIGAATGGSTVNVAGTSGARQIKGVADGADASDAATVGQLGKVSTALSAVSTVASHAVQYDDEQHAHVTLGGASATAPVGLSNVAAGVVSETSTEAVNGSQLHATNRTVSANTASITDLSTGIAKGTLGLVQQAKGQPDGAITIGAATGGSTVNVAGTSGARQIKGVADGVDASDAATVGQLGKIRTAVSTLTDNVIQYDNATRSSVTLGALGATVPVRVSNVAPANLSETSTDAVNGAQLFALSQTVTTHTQAIDALSGVSRSIQASIANLTPSVTLPTQFRYVAVQSDRAAARADGVESVAMGGQAQTRGAYSVAVGSGAQATGEGATALGAQTSAQGKDAVALGRGSLAPDENTVSIGNRETGLTRTLTNVSAGVGPTDAVNVRQLNDAVGGLRSQIEHDRRDASGGTASAVAIASLPQAPAPGQRIVSIGGGTYGGQSAMAVGVSTYAGRWIVKAAGSTNTRGTVAASVGAGYVW